jgi:hypothetical protein
MCAVGPKSRMTHQKLRDLRAPLAELTRALSEQLGWRADAAAADRRRGPVRIGHSPGRADGRKSGRAA